MIVQFFVSALAATSLAHAELTLTTRWPTGGDVCVDAPLKLTFNQAPELGNSGKFEIIRASDKTVVDTIVAGAGPREEQFGDSKLHYEALRLQGNVVSIRIHHLSAGESYVVRIDPGFFKDFGGLHDGWKFSTRKSPPKDPNRIIVSADGKGDFCTVQGAVDQIEPHRSKPTSIFIRKGYYEDLIRIGRDKTHIQLVGESRQETILTAINNDRLNPGGNQRCVLGVEADDFRIENLTVQNTTPYRGSQAEAVTLNAQRCVLRNADFKSFQDTLNLSGRVYVADCYIEGDVDYVWGSGTVCFERCELRSMHDGYLVQARNPVGQAGYVFFDCKLTAPPETKRTWLARIDSGRFPGSHVAFIRCAMGPHVPPAGWEITGAPSQDLRFEEIGSSDLGGQALDLSQRHPTARPPNVKIPIPSPADILGGPDHWDPSH